MGTRAVRLLAILTLALPACAAEENVGSAAGGRQRFAAVPSDIKLVPALDAAQAAGLGPAGAVLQKLIVWPDARRISAHAAPRDRSKEILPVFQLTTEPDPKPLIPGADPPQVAREEAAYWVRKVLKEEWIPEDLDARIILLQENPPSESTVVCRYQADGSSIQVAQTASAVCVVIRPAEALRAEAGDSAKLVPALFRKFFNNGDAMASLDHVKRPLSSADINILTPDWERATVQLAGRNWWCWLVSYTDGKALATLLPKRDEDRPRDPSPGDPWF